MKDEKVLAVRGKPRYENEENWPLEVSPDMKIRGKPRDKNEENWPLEVSPDK